jgi:hypothetical protein
MIALHCVFVLYFVAFIIITYCKIVSILSTVIPRVSLTALCSVCSHWSYWIGHQCDVAAILIIRQCKIDPIPFS